VCIIISRFSHVCFMHFIVRCHKFYILLTSNHGVTCASSCRDSHTRLFHAFNYFFARTSFEKISLAQECVCVIFYHDKIHAQQTMGRAVMQRGALHCYETDDEARVLTARERPLIGHRCVFSRKSRHNSIMALSCSFVVNA
jgi:hypothetical protein